MKIKFTFFRKNNFYLRGTTVVDEVNNYMQLHSNKDTDLVDVENSILNIFSILVYALWVLPMFGHIFICMDIFTDTYYTCTYASNWYIMSLSNFKTVNRGEMIFALINFFL